MKKNVILPTQAWDRRPLPRVVPRAMPSGQTLVKADYPSLGLEVYTILFLRDREGILLLALKVRESMSILSRKVRESMVYTSDPSEVKADYSKLGLEV